MKANIGAVVVTFNRLDKLKKALCAYDNQTMQPDYIIVVDNASTDGTADFLKNWKKSSSSYKKIVIRSKQNLGGSGGFFLGQEQALKENSNWVMLSDDDAYPCEDYIEKIYKYLTLYNNNDISVICGKVIESGKYVNSHRELFDDHQFIDFRKEVPEKMYKSNSFEFDFVSYVGSIFNKSKLRKAGLVCKDFFIYWDDTEHTYRLRKLGKFICLPECSIYHDTANKINYSNNAAWKDYYGYRNRIRFMTMHFPKKKYFCVIYLCARALLSPIRGKKISEVIMRLHAIYDGLFNHMGINDTYKPGWKP